MFQATISQLDGAMMPKRSGSNPRFHELTDAERRWMKKVDRVITAFRYVHEDMPTSYCDAFLKVAVEPGFGPTHYAKKLGVIQAIASRLLLRIGKVASGLEQKRGLGLVDRQPSPTSLRSQEYYLTPEGMKLLRNLLSIGED